MNTILSIEQLIEKVEGSEISSTRTVLNRILAVINNPNAGAFDLKTMIEMDPPLAARVLKRANSAFYGLNRKMVEILDAIVCIGFEAVKELALNQTVCELFNNDDEIYGYSRSSLWVHCVATALCGKFIYRREFQMPGEQIYTAGLLHDIGIIIEDQFLRQHFIGILKDFNKDPAGGLYNYERAVLGYTHADIGRTLAEHWNFPEELCRVIGTEMPPSSLDHENDVMAFTMSVARWACQSRQLGFVETPRIDRQAMRDILKRIDVTERGLDFIMDAVEIQISQMHDEGWF